MEGPVDLIQQTITTAINEWLACDEHDRDAVNSYLDRHESTFVAFGMFIRGMRIRPVYSTSLKLEFHHTPDGMRGIICMNISMFIAKHMLKRN
jgi:hypothetical protein